MGDFCALSRVRVVCNLITHTIYYYGSSDETGVAASAVTNSDLAMSRSVSTNNVDTSTTDTRYQNSMGKGDEIADYSDTTKGTKITHTIYYYGASDAAGVAASAVTNSDLAMSRNSLAST